MTSNNGTFNSVEQPYSFYIFLKINMQRVPKIVPVQFDDVLQSERISVISMQIDKQNVTVPWYYPIILSSSHYVPSPPG